MQRVALVTGASRGIGHAIADVLRQRSVKVVAPTRTELDLADPSSVKSWCSTKMEPFDILVNNAGINELGALTELTDEAWDRMEQINLRSPLCLMRECASGMIRRGWGRVVNITSIWAHVAKKKRGGYAATKAALVAATRNLALECAPYGVLVNAVSPGFVATELTRKNNGPDELRAICDNIPIGRLAEPQEIAKIVAWLVSDENSYITGQTILADGGYTLP